MTALSVRAKNNAVKHFFETKHNQIKFAPPTPEKKPIKNTQLGIEAERKNLEYLDYLLLKNYLYAMDGSQENITFTKKFYPKRKSYLIALLLSIVASKNFSNELKLSALKFVNKNFDLDEREIDKILGELEVIKPGTHIPFDYFNSEEDLIGYGLYNSFQDETIKYASIDSSKGNAYLGPFVDNLEKLNDKLGNDNDDRQLVIKPSPQMQNIKENSQDYYKILQMEPKCHEESEKDFIKRLRKQYFKLALKMHPDKDGAKEDFQELQNAYQYLLKEENHSSERETSNFRPTRRG